MFFYSLTDDFEETRNEIIEKWEECGRQYFLENENELAKLELIDHLPNNYPDTGIDLYCFQIKF